MSRRREVLERVRAKLAELEVQLNELEGRLEARRLEDLRAEWAAVREQHRVALAAGAELSEERLLALGHNLERLVRNVVAARGG